MRADGGELLIPERAEIHPARLRAAEKDVRAVGGSEYEPPPARKLRKKRVEGQRLYGGIRTPDGRESARFQRGGDPTDVVRRPRHKHGGRGKMPRERCAEQVLRADPAHHERERSVEFRGAGGDLSQRTAHGARADHACLREERGGGILGHAPFKKRLCNGFGIRLCH